MFWRAQKIDRLVNGGEQTPMKTPAQTVVSPKSRPLSLKWVNGQFSSSRQRIRARCGGSVPGSSGCRWGSVPGSSGCRWLMEPLALRYTKDTTLSARKHASTTHDEQRTTQQTLAAPIPSLLPPDADHRQQATAGRYVMRDLSHTTHTPSMP
jgi:hypothetical protein